MATPSSRWPLMRALPTAAVLDGLNVKRQGSGLACPCCGSRFEVCDDPNYGVSVRCHNEGCRLGSWAWPEHSLADLRGCGLDEALRLLLDAERDMETRMRRRGRAGARARVAAFVGGAA